MREIKLTEKELNTIKVQLGCRRIDLIEILEEEMKSGNVKNADHLKDTIDRIGIILNIEWDKSRGDK